MWFKNLIFYRFTKPFDLSAEKLEKALEEYAFKPCGSQDISQYGWTSPLGPKANTLVHEGSGCMWLMVKKEEKLLPAAVIKEQVEEKAAAISEAEQRKVSNKEKQQLKDEIIITLLPRAFSRFSTTSAYIDTQSGFLIVDSSSFNKAEELMSHLRKTLGTLPVLPVEVMEAPADVMSKWLLQNTCPAPLQVGEEAELVEPGEEGALVKFKRQPLDSDEVLAHLETGKQVTKLAMSFDERIEFVMNDDLTIKRVKFTELVTDENEEIGHEDPLARTDADFTLMCAEFRTLLETLLKSFGGELLPEERG